MDLQICDTPEAVNCTQLDECLGVANGTVLPSIENCDEFVVCLNQQAVIHKCPENYLFNPILLVCDDSDVVGCYGDQSTEPPKPTTEPPKSTTEGYNACQGQALGTSFPYDEDCQQYILCLGDDESVRAKCPVNAWYDPKTGNCGPNVSPTACQEVATTSTTSSATLSPQELCADQELGVSYPLVSNCEKYILCLGNGEMAIANCIYNAWFDPATGECGQDVSPTACQESYPPTTPQTTTTESPTTLQTTTTPTTTTEHPSFEICSGLLNGQYVSYPDNCSKYVICVEPVPIAFYCTQGYYFSETLQECVDWEQSGCESTGSTELPPLPTPAPGVCRDNGGGTVAYPGNCQWYLHCINDNVYMMSVCNSGEFYDPIRGECGQNVSPDACREEFNPTTTTAVITTTTDLTTISTPTPAQPDPCEGAKEGELVPYPNDCTKFIQCNKPNPVVYDCVEGQEFSAVLKRCMAPWYANCTFTATTKAPVIPTTELPPNPSPNDFCNGKTDGSLVPYPHNCSKYIVCQEPIAVGYACPDDEEFSPVELRCTDAQLANCEPQNKATSMWRALKTYFNFI